MSAQLTVTLSGTLSQRVRQLAHQRHEDVIAIVERILDEGLSATWGEQEWIDLSEPDEAAEREMQAYLRLYPLLKQTYFGKFVAIYSGKLVDYADDFDTLFDRIDQAYPHEYVWISQVNKEPLETFIVRSPRFTEDEYK